MKTTINQLNQELNEIADAHLQVHDYFWGSIFDYTQTREITYPLINCYYPSGSLNKNLTQIQLYIECSDKVYKDRSNLNDTESDTLQVLRDFHNVMLRSTRWNRIARLESATVSKFWERSADEIAGHTMIVSLTLFDTTSICNLPLEGYDFDTSLISSCQPVLIFENDILVDTIQSGGTYSYSTTPSEDATVQNSDLTYLNAVAPGDTLVLPDITIENSDASYSDTIPSVQDYTIPDTTIDVYVNNVLENSVTFATLSNQIINITN